MIDSKQLRCWIGWFGMALPWIVVIQSFIFGLPHPDSISATYYRDVCIVPFMIILGSAGVLLCNYRGYTKTDNIINTIAGIAAFCVCLFPCKLGNSTARVGTFQLPSDASDIVHLISALLFFGILAYNSLFQFTKGVADPTLKKKIRNGIFRICGIGMIASFILLPLAHFDIVDLPHAFWWTEMFALTFFGISWLTKANKYRWLFAD